MKRTVERILLVVLGMMLGTGATAWFLLGARTYTFTFTEEELRDHLAQRMPLKKVFLGRFSVVFDNPRVTLEEATDHIHIGIDVKLEGIKFKVREIGLQTPAFTGSGDLLSDVDTTPTTGRSRWPIPSCSISKFRASANVWKSASSRSPMPGCSSIWYRSRSTNLRRPT
ncbi:MAG: hypothetical protein O2955_19745 [Planctomycetota bacterium]|nr:hypothetical protein [Planctomycetota bacterium]MDA1214748.1 hypothetical protein [Planctomycetota bacterium]